MKDNSTTGRTWQQNADEFAALDAGEGWPFARLVACSVEKGKRPPKSGYRRDRDDKVGAREFAQRASTSADRVLRYLEGWKKAAAAGVVPDASTLTPSDAHKISDPDQPWEAIYDASGSGGRPRDSKPEDAAKIIQRRGAQAVMEALAPEEREEVAETLFDTIVENPSLRARMHEAIAREYATQERVKPEEQEMDLPEQLADLLDKDKKGTRRLSAFVGKVVGEVPEDVLEQTVGSHCDKQQNAYGLIRSQIKGGKIDDALKALLDAETEAGS